MIHPPFYAPRLLRLSARAHRDLRAVLNPSGYGGGKWDVYGFSNGTSPNASVFEVPPECQPGSPTLRAGQALAGAGVDGPVAQGPNPVATATATTPSFPAILRSPTALAAAAEARADTSRFRTYAAPAGFATPASYDGGRFATPVRDQSSCGGCWAFSSAAATEIVFNKKRFEESNGTVRAQLFTFLRLFCFILPPVHARPPLTLIIVLALCTTASLPRAAAPPNFTPKPDR